MPSEPDLYTHHKLIYHENYMQVMGSAQPGTYNGGSDAQEPPYTPQQSLSGRQPPTVESHASQITVAPQSTSVSASNGGPPDRDSSPGGPAASNFSRLGGFPGMQLFGPSAGTFSPPGSEHAGPARRKTHLDDLCESPSKRSPSSLDGTDSPAFGYRG